MHTEPQDLDDRALLVASHRARLAVGRGDEEARRAARAYEAEVRRRFTGFVPLKPTAVRTPPNRRRTLWAALRSWWR